MYSTENMKEVHSSKSKFELVKQSLTLVLEDSASSSTAHAVTRVATPERDVKVRVLWFLAFLFFLGLTMKSSTEYISRLQNPQVKSDFQAEEVDFEFPDVYFCNSLQVAGSFSCLLDEAEADKVRVPFRTAGNLFSATLDYLNASSNPVLQSLQLLSSIQSLSYKTLADIVGQRKLQTFYRNYGVFTAGSSATLSPPINIETLYHPDHLKCFKLALTTDELRRMQNPNNRLQLDILLDPFFFTFHWLDLYSKFLLPIGNFKNSVGGYNLIYPFDWNLENPFEIDRGSGMYMYLVPRGHYPSRLTTNQISLAPGRAYDISISMSDSQMNPADFPDQCVSVHEPVRFYNPYDGSADVFEYSDAYCYYSEIAREAQRRFNCSPTPSPLPWDFRHLSLCLNLSAYSSMEDRANRVKAAMVARQQTAENSSNAWEQSCSSKRLCLHRKYQVTSSYGMWPNTGSLYRMVFNMFGSLLKVVDPKEFRSLLIGVNTIERTATFVSPIEYEDGVWKYFERAALRVTIRSENTRSNRLTFRLNYQLSQFIADVGGVLGLYLGCSLLTLLELLELLYAYWPFGFNYN